MFQTLNAALITGVFTQVVVLWLMALLKTLNCSQNTQSQASMHFLTTGILPLLPFGMRWNMCANFKSRKRATVFFKLHLEVVSNAIARCGCASRNDLVTFKAPKLPQYTRRGKRENCSSCHGHSVAQGISIRTW